jgi:hypothetical protein
LRSRDNPSFIGFQLYSGRPRSGSAGFRIDLQGGALPLRETDRKIGLLNRVRRCFSDYRHPAFVEHELGELLAQRIYGLALGYEDLNDHEELRRDPLLAGFDGRQAEMEEPLASKSTLNRRELIREIDYWTVDRECGLLGRVTNTNER